jgi:hypothetical protein
LPEEELLVPVVLLEELNGVVRLLEEVPLE